MTATPSPLPSVYALRKRAKSLRRQWRLGDADALLRIRVRHPRFSTDAEVQPAEARLTHCQLVIARELGYASWPQLIAATEASRHSLAEEFVDLACLCYDDPHYDHRSFHRRANDLLRRHPDLVENDIWAASAAGNIGIVESLLRSQPDLLDRPGPHGWVPLLCACSSRVEPLKREHSTEKVAELLLRHGASARAATLKLNDPPGSPNARRFTALTLLWGGGSTGLANQPPHPRWRELARLLLEHGAEPADEWGLSIHADAALPILLEHGLSPDIRATSGGDSLTLLGRELCRAAQAGAAERVDLLLSKGARTEETWHGRTPWQHAEAGGHLAIASRLKNAGAPTQPLSNLELFIAHCLAGDEKATRALLAEHPGLLKLAPHALVNRAVDSGRFEGVRLALELGFDPSFLDEVTPLHQAVTRGRRDLVDLLLAHGGSLGVRDPFYDSTPVGWADFFDQLAVRDHLLDQGAICLLDALDYSRPDRLADILERDPQSLERTRAETLTRPPTAELSMTPLLRAVEIGSLEAVRILLAHGADRQRRHPDRRTPRQLALDLGHLEIASALGE
jgi:ankyrin repeat protein